MVQNATPELITIYTDGACHGNPGAGGWGAVLRFRDYEKQIYGGEAGTTNNRMELMAAIEALESIFRPHPVVLHTDSRYVCDGISKWIAGWKANGWKTSTRQPVKNEDLWRRLDAAAKQLDVEWAWVKGHAGIEGNELADALATRGVVEFGGGRERSPSDSSTATRQRPRGGRRRKRHRP